jgi:hypothetical protein
VGPGSAKRHFAPHRVRDTRDNFDIVSRALVASAQTGLSWPGTSFPEATMRRLLFLNGIKAFEAAARSGSFAGAGLELNVSAAAISRMVHLLEQRLGVSLFERKANRLVTTAAGRAYQNGLTPIFDALASLTAQVTATSSARVLTIGVGPTFAMRWLIPRLAEFRKSEPDIEVRITPAAWQRPLPTIGAAASRSAMANGLISSPSRCSPPTCCRSARRSSPLSSSGPPI